MFIEIMESHRNQPFNQIDIIVKYHELLFTKTQFFQEKLFPWIIEIKLGGLSTNFQVLFYDYKSVYLESKWNCRWQYCWITITLVVCYHERVKRINNHKCNNYLPRAKKKTFIKIWKLWKRTMIFYGTEKARFSLEIVFFTWIFFTGFST